MGQNSRKRTEIICRCNSVSRDTIEQAIVNGCDTLNKIFDETQAGVGPCGGSCRRKLRPLLESYLKNKTFPERIVEDPRVPVNAPAPGYVDPDKKNEANNTAADDIVISGKGVLETDSSVGTGSLTKKPFFRGGNR